MTMHHPGIADIVRRDPRYAYEAYDFVFEALKHTQEMLGRSSIDRPGREPGNENHVSGKQLLEGIRDLALSEFGLMARTVFKMWGIQRTDDIGEIVFNLVEANQMSKTNEDCRADFHGVFDWTEALDKSFRIRIDETE
jgi:uncharacterized repeat protein (TIGR04138 family)